MKIIQISANENGSRPPLQEWDGALPPEGFAWCADEFAEIFYSTSPAGFVDITVEDSSVSAVTINQAALDAYKESHRPDLNVLRDEKETEISAACNAAIVAGMDVETSAGVEHFSLEETDQINLTTAVSAIQSGAAGYPYHADGSLCRMFTAAELLAVAEAATAHKLYHTTLCNHLLTWARRAETADEISGITYSAEGLPEDLAENMAAVLTSATGV